MHRFRITLPEIILLVVLAVILGAFFHQVAREAFDSRETVWDIEFSPDGKLLVRASELGVAVFDRTTWELVHRFEGMVADLAISSDSKLLAAGGTDGSLSIWDLATGELVAEMGDHSQWVKVAFSPDSTKLYSRGRGETAVKVWNTHDGQPAGEFETHGNVHGFGLSPDGRILATGTTTRSPDGHEVELWEVETGRRISRLTGPEHGGIENLVFAADNRTLAIGLSVLKVRIRDIGEESGRNRLIEVRGNESLQFSPSGKWVATTHWEGAAVWDAESGARVAQFGNHKGHLEAVEFSPDEEILLTAGEDGTVNTWEIATGELLDRVTGLTIRPNPIPWSTLAAFGLWLTAWTGMAVRSGGRQETLPEGSPSTGRGWGKTLVPVAGAYFILNGLVIIGLCHQFIGADPIQFLFGIALVSALFFAGTGVLMFTRRLGQQWSYGCAALVIFGFATGYDFFLCARTIASV